MADDSVVVMKFQPVKAGNPDESGEEKTETTFGLSKGLLLLKRQQKVQREEVILEQ